MYPSPGIDHIVSTYRWRCLGGNFWGDNSSRSACGNRGSCAGFSRCSFVINHWQLWYIIKGWRRKFSNWFESFCKEMVAWVCSSWSCCSKRHSVSHCISLSWFSNLYYATICSSTLCKAVSKTGRKASINAELSIAVSTSPGIVDHIATGVGASWHYLCANSQRAWTRWSIWFGCIRDTLPRNCDTSEISCSQFTSCVRHRYQVGGGQNEGACVEVIAIDFSIIISKGSKCCVKPRNVALSNVVCWERMGTDRRWNESCTVTHVCWSHSQPSIVVKCNTAGLSCPEEIKLISTWRGTSDCSSRIDIVCSIWH